MLRGCCLLWNPSVGKATMTRSARFLPSTSNPQRPSPVSKLKRASRRTYAGTRSPADLARLISGARCLVAGNTGPAHLAAAVGTPVVSLFAPVVPAVRWAPYGVPHVLLGDQTAPCRGTRARECPVPGHPCLAGVGPDVVVAAVARLTGHSE